MIKTNSFLRFITTAILIAEITDFCYAQTSSLFFVSAVDEIYLTSDEKALVRLTNAERSKEGLTALTINAKLMTAARNHSKNMARLNTMSHKLSGKGPAERVSAVGYNYRMVAENVAYNQRTIDAVIKSWMESPSHRANILNPNYKEIGVGIAYNKKKQPYYTQVFGRR
jgi:uncharacterized protein YkwD